MSPLTHATTEQFDEETLPEPEPAPRGHTGRRPSRQACVLDFKSHDTTVRINHGPADPSRIWVVLESPTAALHVSVEEKVGRDLAAGLTRALSTFQAVRSGRR
jgi:hypothetical protein